MDIGHSMLIIPQFKAYSLSSVFSEIQHSTKAIQHKNNE